MTAREEILARVRRAGAGAAVTVPRDYRGPGRTQIDGDTDDSTGNNTGGTDIVALFAERVDDYRATVHRCAPDELADTVAGILGGRHVVLPPGLPAELSAGLAADPARTDPARTELVADDPPLTAEQLDAADAVLTTCACAVANTGTVVLDHRDGQGRRALTLVPDHHVVVVRADQIVAGVPDAVAALDPRQPQTWISGPSATSDIELQRVEGVHGPRRLDVVIVGPR